MSVKKKIAMSMGSIALGAMSVMGGTFAYFSDEVEANSKFTNGTLNLQPEKPYLEHFTLTNWKPGDRLEANIDNKEPAMVLNNQGTLPMNVFMKLDTSDVKGSTDAIIVKSLSFGDTDLLTKYLPGETEVTLTELDAALEGNTTLNGNPISGVGKYIGYLDADDPNSTTETSIKSVKYVLEFKDTGVAQNELQGDEITLDYTFTGLQYEGETFNDANGNITTDQEVKRNDGINDRETADDKTN
jgi:spore coat-associated protein N